MIGFSVVGDFSFADQAAVELVVDGCVGLLFSYAVMDERKRVGTFFLRLKGETMDRCPLFLDSGAHGLYTREVMKKVPVRMRHRVNPYEFYETNGFWEYVDSYAAFLKLHPDIRLYANVDVIFNPKLSWKVLKYLEREHGLSPVPVIHFGTEVRWVKRHLDAGYEFLGIGGLGQEAQRRDYVGWADTVFRLVCSGADRMPLVRTHGFAIGSPSLMRRYPWWSVDSATWVKSAGFGKIFVPRKKSGKWDFFHHLGIDVSDKSPSLQVKGQHITNLSPGEKRAVIEWLDEIGVPLGSMTDSKNDTQKTVMNHRSCRILANLHFFKGLVRSLPWPRPFGARKVVGRIGL